jgi:hypothetical protein
VGAFLQMFIIVSLLWIILQLITLSFIPGLISGS